MHRTIAWLLLGLALASQGCAMSRVLTRNVVVDPLHYDYESDSLFRKLRYGKLAETAWERAQESAPQPYSKHYGRGFKQAFSDFLDGGEGRTPLVPPRRYWAQYYQSPEGNEAIQDWFAGWRHGVAAARESGYRNLIVIPTIYQPSEQSNSRFFLNTGEVAPRPPAPSGDKHGEMPKAGDGSKPDDAAKPGVGPKPLPPVDGPPAGPAAPPIKPPADAKPPVGGTPLPAADPKGPGDTLQRPIELPKKPDVAPDKPKPEMEEYEPLVTPEKR